MVQFTSFLNHVSSRLAKTLDLSSVATAALAAATNGNHQPGAPEAGSSQQRRVLQTSEAMLKKNLEYNSRTINCSDKQQMTSIQGFGTLPRKKKSREKVLETHFDDPKVRLTHMYCSHRGVHLSSLQREDVTRCMYVCMYVFDLHH